MKYILILLLLALPSLKIVADSIELAIPVATELKMRKSNWVFEVKNYYPNGNAQTIIFYEPGLDGKNIAVKRLLLSPEGYTAYIEDVIEKDINESEKETIVPHGAGVSFYPTGAVKHKSHFKDGVLHGPMQLFYENGALQEDANFYENNLHGPVTTYYENGQIKDKSHYNHANPIGEFVSYYENGNLSMQKMYVDGLLEGASMEWDDKGMLKSTRLFSKGLLHANSAPAVILYSDSGKIMELQHYKEGQPEGLHQKFHPNSAKSYQVSYVQGSKDGDEEFFAENGESLGGGSYQKGRPIKKHIIKYSSGVTQKIAHFDNNGKLLQPIEEFYSSGQAKSRYTVDDRQQLDGHYAQWFEEGPLKLQYCYCHGTLDGEQKEYYLNGNLKLLENYANGQQNGLYVKSYENGVIEFKGELKDSKLVGLVEGWHENNQLKFQVNYANGLIDGPFQSWHENGNLHQDIQYALGEKNGAEEVYYLSGQKQISASYINGKLHGSFLSWFEDGEPLFICEYDEGAPVGEHKHFYPITDKNLGHILKSEEHFKNGKREGRQAEYYPSGRLCALVDYTDGLLDGKKAFWNENGELEQEIFYHKNNLHGRFFIRNKDTSEFICHYNEGLKEGENQMFYPVKKDGSKQLAVHAFYKNDLLEGDVLEYNLQGMIMAITPYKEGKKEGTTKVFDEKGVLRLSVNYSKGVQEGDTKQFYPSGAISKVTIYKNGQKDGEENAFAENGEMISQYHFINGKLDGYCFDKNKDGLITFEAEYKNGERHGKFNKFYDDGQPKLLQNFFHDKLHGTKKVYNELGALSETEYEMGEKIK